jgi:hypothetical protein
LGLRAIARLASANAFSYSFLAKKIMPIKLWVSEMDYNESLFCQGIIGKELLSGKKIVIILDRLDIYYREVVQCEKYMATTGGKKPPERSC